MIDCWEVALNQDDKKKKSRAKKEFPEFVSEKQKI